MNPTISGPAALDQAPSEVGRERPHLKDLRPPASAMARAVKDFKTNGFTIFEGALPVEFVDRVREAYLEALWTKVARFKLARAEQRKEVDRTTVNEFIDFKPQGGNHDINRWNMHLPSRDPFLDDRLLAHPQVAGLLDAVLGEEAVAFLLASDTPFPGADQQTIHRDFPRFGITVNIPLVDFTPELAPLEIWPGTHLDHLVTDQASFHDRPVATRQEVLQGLTQESIPLRPLLRRGDILVRDQRTIHRGTPNRTERPRPALSLWFKRPCGLSPTRLSIPVPHRGVADWVSRKALGIRERGRGDGSAVNAPLVNVGNRLGMFNDELALSDRDYRRQIPKPLWEALAPRTRRFLRYAQVEGAGWSPPDSPSLLGSTLLAAFGMAACVYARFKS